MCHFNTHKLISAPS